LVHAVGRVFATVLLAAHGATYLRLKTTGPVHERSERLARGLWVAVTVLSYWCRSRRGSSAELFQSMFQRRFAWLALGHRCQCLGHCSPARGSAEGRAFAGSCG
jgi:cytochrome bd-type quinol oxidase subunit 2